MRDLEKNPYSPDERRVAEFFFERGLGGGDDPIGAILASHQALADERNELQQLFDFRYAADQRAIKRWHAAHPDKENIWPDHVELVIWLLEQIEGMST